jgi:hypothetical protein
MKHSIADGTRNSYDTGLKRWKSYCEYRYWNHKNEITTAHAEEWLAAMADEGKVNVNSMKVYRSALSSYYVENTPAVGNQTIMNPLDHPRIERILNGIARDQAGRRQLQFASRPKTKGITMDMIIKLIDTFKDGNDKQLMCTAAASLAFASALRPSELLGSAKLPDRSLRINQMQFFSDTAGDHLIVPQNLEYSTLVSLVPDHCVITLHVGKTNQLRTAKPRYIAIAPIVRILWCWFTKRIQYSNAVYHMNDINQNETNSDELFKRVGYKPLRMSSLLSFLKQELPLLGFSDMNKLTGKTFRIGGTSALTTLGVPEEDIRTMGGWSKNSTVWRQYASTASLRHRAILTQRNIYKQSSSTNIPSNNW